MKRSMTITRRPGLLFGGGELEQRLKLRRRSMGLRKLLLPKLAVMLLTFGAGGLDLEANPSTSLPPSHKASARHGRAGEGKAAAEPVEFRDFLLTGNRDGETITFELTGTAHVSDRAGGRLVFVSGAVALVEMPTKGNFEILYEDGSYQLNFKRPGRYSVSLRFRAAVRRFDELSPATPAERDVAGKLTAGRVEDGHEVRFGVVSAPIRLVELMGFSESERVELDGATRPVRDGDVLRAHLGLGSGFSLTWRREVPEVSSKLFYASRSDCCDRGFAGIDAPRPPMQGHNFARGDEEHRISPFWGGRDNAHRGRGIGGLGNPDRKRIWRTVTESANEPFAEGGFPADRIHTLAAFSVSRCG